jgi:hypothetical protein
LRKGYGFTPVAFFLLEVSDKTPRVLKTLGVYGKSPIENGNLEPSVATGDAMKNFCRPPIILLTAFGKF